MPLKSRLPEKAYKNLQFLNSPEARTIRILSEFLEPMSRFRREKIRDTIVFFGSARILPRSAALKALKEAERKRKRRGGEKLVEQAKVAHQMSGYYENTVRLSYLLTKWSNSLKGERRFVVCSGGGPGIMEAANQGAKEAGGPSIGLNISLPFEQAPNRYIPSHLSFEFHYFFMRKFWFMYPAKALVMLPGGYGTLDEMMEVLTLVQTKKIVKPMPVILYGRGYWESIINFRELLRLGMISPADLKIFSFADSPEEAFSILKSKLSRHYL